jgi:hypothetical protein
MTKQEFNKLIQSFDVYELSTDNYIHTDEIEKLLNGKCLIKVLMNLSWSIRFNETLINDIIKKTDENDVKCILIWSNSNFKNKCIWRFKTEEDMFNFKLFLS